MHLVQKKPRQQARLDYIFVSNVPVYNFDNRHRISDSDLQIKINDSKFLETLLLIIRGETIKYASNLKKKQDLQEQILLSHIETLENSNSDSNLTELETKKTELQKLRENKVKGAYVRSRVQWLKEGEKPSKFFCALERSNYLEKTMKRVHKSDGQIITDQKEILTSIKDYYQNLFQNKDTKLCETNFKEMYFYNNATILNEKDAQELEGPLLITELSNALKVMKNGKTPGIDGFPPEFFKVFWGNLKFFILRALNHAYECGEMSISLRQCIITCLPKGDKPRQFLKNFRPISLLSVIYKIGSSAIANRIKKILDYVISPEQSGFISGRYIGDSTRLIYDLMCYTDQKNIPGLLMLVDFEKAFDSVSWKFLYSVLKLLGFGSSIIQWIKTFNKNIKATIMQCGIMSEFFDIGKGCRQGDPIAPYLFIMCAQVLILMLKHNKSVRGITIGHTEFKLT